MRYRGLVKKRLLPVEIEGDVPDIGTPVTFAGADAGEMRTGMGDQGIALLRLEQVRAAVQAGKPLMAGESKITPKHPPWLPDDDERGRSRLAPRMLAAGADADKAAH